MLVANDYKLEKDRMRGDPSGSLYFLRALTNKSGMKGLTKIGRAWSLAERLPALTREHGKLEIVKVIECSHVNIGEMMERVYLRISELN